MAKRVSSEDHKEVEPTILVKGRRSTVLIRSSFEPTTWQAFWRTVIDGRSPGNVAEELSLSRWAAYKARSRVLHRLRMELEGLEELD
jgi:RNA polymerase sigma-70 factor (ECF subfamily)